MKSVFSAAMRKATQLTHEGKLIEATRAIQRALSRRDNAEPDIPAYEKDQLVELQTNKAQCLNGFERPGEDVRTESASLPNAAAADRRPTARMRKPLGDALKLSHHADLPSFGHDSGPLLKFRKTPPITAPDGAAYLSRTFACEGGARDYKLYIPSHTGGRKPPLIIMLHGCTQNPDDFAVGTGMNWLAEEHGFVVAYPGQVTSANHLNCWSWFDPKDQRRDRGEPSIIAGITRRIIADQNIDAERVYVAGLSAGGAMAEIMGVTYPELFAATGIHSGLAYGSATDVTSAFAAMNGGKMNAAPAQRRRHATGRKAGVRTIIFHGTSDRKVHPSNAKVILDDARAGLVGATQEMQHDGSAGGRAYTRTVIVDARGVPHVEHWAIEGLGHAWSGGNPEGSYTDRHGPDASREMLRFFLTSTVTPSAT